MALPLEDAPLERPLAILLGSEREGLPDDLIADRYKVTIETPGAGGVAERRRRGCDRALRVLPQIENPRADPRSRGSLKGAGFAAAGAIALYEFSRRSRIRERILDREDP